MQVSAYINGKLYISKNDELIYVENDFSNISAMKEIINSFITKSKYNYVELTKVFEDWLQYPSYYKLNKMNIAAANDDDSTSMQKELLEYISRENNTKELSDIIVYILYYNHTSKTKVFDGEGNNYYVYKIELSKR